MRLTCPLLVQEIDKLTAQFGACFQLLAVLILRPIVHTGERCWPSATFQFLPKQALERYEQEGAINEYNQLLKEALWASMITVG